MNNKRTKTIVNLFITYQRNCFYVALFHHCSFYSFAALFIFGGYTVLNGDVIEVCFIHHRYCTCWSCEVSVVFVISKHNLGCWYSTEASL